MDINLPRPRNLKTEFSADFIKKKEYLQVLLIVAEKTPVYEIEKQDFKE